MELLTRLERVRLFKLCTNFVSKSTIILGGFTFPFLTHYPYLTINMSLCSSVYYATKRRTFFIRYCCRFNICVIERTMPGATRLHVYVPCPIIIPPSKLARFNGCRQWVKVK